MFRSATSVVLRGGEHERRPAHTAAFSGWYTVLAGTVNTYDTRGHTWLPSVDISGNALKISGSESNPGVLMTRAPGVEEALKQGEDICGVSWNGEFQVVVPVSASERGGRSGFAGSF